MRKRRRGRMKRPNEGAAVEIFDFGYRKRIGAHDIPKTKDFQLFDFVGETDVIGRGAASEPLKLAGSLQGTLASPAATKEYRLRDFIGE